MTDPLAMESKVRASDIAAFRHKHPLDQHSERLIRRNPDGTSIVESRFVFEIFAFGAEGLGDVVFDVRGIKKAFVDGKLPFKMFDVELSEEWVEHIRNNGGVETGRMSELTVADLERPGICAFWPGIGYTTVIDGNNRLVRRWDDGLRTFRFATTPVGAALMPYLCRPGEEEKFFDREQPPDREVLARKRIR